jgi:hypothetical protein
MAGKKEPRKSPGSKRVMKKRQNRATAEETPEEPQAQDEGTSEE